MTVKTTRTRIAPSPTGEDFHIGNAYTALINYIVSRKDKGQFVIRIEDTDQSRKVEGSEERIFQSLAWLGLTPDEGPHVDGPHKPYRQSERLSIYTEYAKKLIQNKHAYYCFCSPETLSEMRKEQQKQKKPPKYDGRCKKLTEENIKKRFDNNERYVVRLSVPKDGTTIFTDIIRGEISFENKLIDDQVLLKSDGYPTYHMGVVVDDHLMGISHIIRGEEWISSTPKHILLYTYFGWDIPQFAHMPLLRNPDKSKLSKRRNPVWVSWYKEEGFFPEAVLNYLGTLAWSHPDEKEIFSVEEMSKVFSLSDVQTTAPVFDVNKLRWMNGEYIREMKSEKLKMKIFLRKNMMKK
ncbi:glutamate--tRNA ligase [Patescibacteria group bacterium]